MQESKNDFVSPSKGKLHFNQVVDDLIAFINADPSSQYTVIVGTDSEQSRQLAEFVSVVLVHRVGKFGRYFWQRDQAKVFDRHDRILKEAYRSLELAQRIVDALRERLSERLYDFEIHLDIGQNGPTKTMIQEIVGLIVGNGFKAKIKPDSYAANKVADKHVRPVRFGVNSKKIAVA